MREFFNTNNPRYGAARRGLVVLTATAGLAAAAFLSANHGKAERTANNVFSECVDVLQPENVILRTCNPVRLSAQ